MYIAGKITGMDKAQAMSLFGQASAILKENDYIPIDPFDVCEDTPGKHWSEYMGECHRELLRCNAIVMLPNWHDSRGARIEYAVAREMGIQVVFAQEQCGELEIDVDLLYL